MSQSVMPSMAAKKTRVSSGYLQVKAAVAVSGDTENTAVSVKGGIDSKDAWVAVGRERSHMYEKRIRTKY